MTAAGWYVCTVIGGTKRTWHYFAEGSNRAMCGTNTFKLTGEHEEFTTVMSWFYREKANSCSRCGKRAPQ